MSTEQSCFLLTHTALIIADAGVNGLLLMSGDQLHFSPQTGEAVAAQIKVSDEVTATAPHSPAGNLSDLPFHEAVAALERELVRRALEAAGGNRAEAARLLGINRRLLYSKMEEHGLT